MPALFSIVLIACLILALIQFNSNPLKKLQSLADSVSPLLNSEISSAVNSDSIEYRKSPYILVVWRGKPQMRDTDEICIEISEKKIPTIYYPKSI